METTLIIGIVVAGFVAVQYLHYKHTTRLELLLKAKDIHEVKQFEAKPEKITVGPSLPETAIEAAQDRTPDQIREQYKN